MKTTAIHSLLEKIDAYKRKYYLNQLLKGSIFAVAVVLSAFLLFNALEYFGRFGTGIRTMLFFVFMAALLLTLVSWVIRPLLYLYGTQKPLSNTDAAQQIGTFFPEIADKLLNTLQLASISSPDNSLLEASIAQKTKQLGVVRFADAIRLEKNRQYLKYAIAPAAIILAILLASPRFFKESSTRIVNFQNEYAEDAPFSFVLQNKNLLAFRNEDYSVSLALEGNTIPDAVYLIANDRKFKMETSDQKNYSYTFKKVQKNFDFRFDAAGFKSNEFDIQIVERPALSSFDITLNYPSYLGKANESLQNSGNLTIPEGTIVEWNFKTTDADSVILTFENDHKRYFATKKLLRTGFGLERRAKNSEQYSVSLKNNFASNKEAIGYYISVIPDKFPQIALEQYKDSTLYNYLVLGGNIADDYGFSKLNVFYRVLRAEKDNNASNYQAIALPLNHSQSIQSFYFQWQTDSLRLAPGERIEYYVQVWDNDGVNGAKTARTTVMSYSIPSKNAIEKEIDNAAEKAEAQLDKVLNKAQKLKKDITAMENRLKNKKELDFQDKKQAEELIKKREELVNEIKNLQEQNKALSEKQQRFNEQKPELSKKMEDLQKLMQDLMDKETQKLYEDLKKLMEEQQQDPQQNEKMLEQLEKMKNKERNLEKEMERMKELFKKMQVEQKLDKAIKDLDKLAEKQDKLAEKTEQTDKKLGDDKQKTNDELKKEQDKLKKEFEDIRKDMKEAEKLNNDQKDSQPMDMDQQQQQDIQNEQQNSQDALDKNQDSQAAKAQKNASKKMKSLSKKMAGMKMSMEMKENEENMSDLRNILENLVHISFDQEQIMKDFKNISVTDPRFVKLSQDQLNLQDDAKVIEDSLYSLASRVLQIKSFVTREVSNMKNNMDESMRFIRERRLPQAAVKQQYAMTSINNLALMLSDVLKQMQAQMMAMTGMGSGKQKKNGNNEIPGLGKMQEKLSQQMQKVKEQGKGGKGMSEQLAQMAAQQAQIRKMLQGLLDSQKGTEKGKQMGDQVNDLLKKMEENETELVNKRLTQELINRQKEITTRLLESEKALQEQEEDNKRKAETARQVARKVPPQFEQYVRDKQKQTELLRTVPPALSPFYKREVDTYFKKIQ